MQKIATISRYAWIAVFLLAPVALLNYMDRQMMAAMKYSLMDGIPSIATESNWGLLPAVFKWTYALLSPIGGYIADRFSKKHVIVFSLLVWSIITWATGHANTFEQLIWTRAIMGISEAFYIPAALALISEFHHGNTRSRAVGIHQMAIYLGIIIGGFSGYVAESPNYGWRWAFDAAGLVGIAYAFVLFFSLRNPLPSEMPGGETVHLKESALKSVAELFSNKYFIIMIIYFTLPGFAGWVVKDWMPAILKDMFDISQGFAGVSAALWVNVASLAGAVVGGIMADKWMQRNDRGRIYTAAIGVFFLVPALFGVGNAGSLMVAVTFLVVFGLGWGLFDCNNMPILCQIVRPELRATGYGFMNMISISCGGFSDWGFGVMRDMGVALNIIFGAFALVCLITVALVLMIKPNRALIEADERG